MDTDEKISGWLFVEPKSTRIIFVSRFGQGDDNTGLPWNVLTESGNLEAFRRDFAFDEVHLSTFCRFTINVEIAFLQRWFEIRKELK